MSTDNKTMVLDRVGHPLPALAPWTAELRETFRLAWPLVIAQLAQMSLITTDVIMMGWLGAEHLAAGTLASAFMHPFLLFGTGTITAVAPLVAQALGRRDYRSVRRSTRQGCWIAIGLAALMIPLLWQVGPIFLLLGQQPGVTALAQDYVHYAVWLFIPSLMFVSLRSFLSAHGATRVILWITVVGIFVNAIGNYALMFGHFGMPRMELRGAGVSTVAVSTLTLLLSLGYILTHRRFKRYRILVRFWKPDWPRFREILRIGAPIGLTLMAETGMFAGAAMMMGWLGSAELAAHAVALQCAALAFMVPMGLSMATTVRVGLAYGRGDRDGVGRAGWTSLALGVGFMATTATLFVLAPGMLISAFLDASVTGNQAAYVLAISYLGVAALFQIVDGAQVVSASALRGLSDTAAPMVVAIGGYWLFGLPIAYVCAFVLDLRGLGIWYGLASGLAFVAIVLTIRFRMRERLGLVQMSRA